MLYIQVGHCGKYDSNIFDVVVWNLDVCTYLSIHLLVYFFCCSVCFYLFLCLIYYVLACRQFLFIYLTYQACLVAFSATYSLCVQLCM